ncbi:hypothetical protein VHEMI02629 [[Torrubiella] hemipterigena]|uniref:R3H domain-containing protein n=1 Tax=[Torrubiella] hemipterigena TaxID=1531966 RepID=A0A0A1T8Q7_9HYPO|nr:hypothetical protein VHEMI02629 [[Torrubiella] hemipterigena]
MSEASGSQTQTQTSESSRGRSRQGQRGGRANRQRKPQDGASVRGSGASTAGEPSTTQPNGASEQSSPSNSQQQSRSSRGGRGQRGQRQNGRGQGRRPEAPTKPATRRAFGGHLTSEAHDDTQSETGSLSLSGDAPVFVPGQPIVARSKPIPSRPKRPAVQLPKSTATDLPTRIHEDIGNFNYECAICTDDVTRSSQVWSCTICWTVIHLRCAKKWYSNQMKQQDNTSSQPQREPLWRCPGCNSQLSDDPGSYHCWCSKEINPKPSSTSLPPHSCGQTCSKPRATCPHPCSLQCHAGPCPPCGLVGPTQSCFCGKNSSQKLCRETNYEKGWSCEEICGDLLPCGEHFCPRPCHTGLCGDCDMKIEARCYCGKLQKQIPCFERDDPEQSYSQIDGEWFEGLFNCQTKCNRPFDCGIHKCSNDCHPQDEDCGHCPYSPDVVTHCPCGKTLLEELPGFPRSTCEDKVSHCDKVCGKELKCGHACQAVCHDGDCGSCLQKVDIPCRCGRVVSKSACHQGTIDPPMCMRICQANLNCGRHKCGDHCCSGEKKALERQAARKKHRVTFNDSIVEPEHICIRTCNRPLKCGNHDCQQMCHRGPCGNCPEAIFTEISCDCGRTVLQPPQPCGTQAPECRFNCRRRPQCGHPAVDHNCHPGDISCPKCPFLVDKICACGKEKLHSQPCHLQEARCGKPCGKKLKCGLHTCKKLCHKDGECEDADQTTNRCQQACGKVKLFCEHKCSASCHGQSPCNETAACTAKATISCPCGIRTQEVRCLASSSNPEPTRLEIKCDDECLRLERNRRLAAALNIDPASHANDHVPYADVTLRLYQDTTSWCEVQEREFRVFANAANEIRLRFKPMNKTQRQFLHVLAEDYGLEGRSEDAEPYRYVVVFKGPRFVSAPSKTLGQCVKIRATQAAEAAASAAASRGPSPPPMPALDPFNGILLTAPKFGLTMDEVTTAMISSFSQQPSLNFHIEFLGTDEVLMRATVQYSSFLSPAGVGKALADMKSHVVTAVRRLELAGNVLLCHADSDNHITRREDIRNSDTSGWSAVAGRAANKEPALPEEPTARGSGRKLLGLKKKKIEPSKSSWSTLGGDVEC